MDFGTLLEELVASRTAQLAQHNEKLSADLQESERAQRLLLTLNQTSSRLENALTTEQVFEAVSGSLCKLGIATMILTVSEDGSRLFPAHLSHQTKKTKALRKAAGLKPKEFSILVKSVPLLKGVLEKEDTHYVRDSRRLFQKAMIGTAGDSGEKKASFLTDTQSIIMPFKIGNRIIGVFCVMSDSLFQGDVAAFNAFTHQMAAAWHKAELLQQLRAQQQDLEEQLNSRVMELKKFQEQLYQVQQLEAIGKLAGGVAHDFNNILGGITNYTKLIIMKAGEPEYVKNYAAKISDSAVKAADLTRQLLTFACKANIEIRPFNVHQSIASTIKILKHSVDKSIAIESRLGAKKAVLKGDVGLIESALLNLAVNARDTMIEGGSLLFKTAIRKLNKNSLSSHGIQAVPGQYMEISVSDTGPGMDDNLRKHIFEPFFTTKEIGKGTGLGLASVYGAVKQHNGYITVESKPGKGSTFCLYLPAIKKPALVSASGC